MLKPRLIPGAVLVATALLSHALVAGGASAAPQAPPDGRTPAERTPDDGRSARAERVKAAIPQLEAYVERTMAETGVPGIAVAIVHEDEPVHLKGFGVRRVGQDAAVDPDTVFQLASVSKPIAATVISALVGEGVIDWDDRIIEHDPGFCLHDPWATREVTFRDLLCHRTGLPEHAGDLLEDLGYSREEILRRLRHLKPASSFRAEHAYTNFAFTEAGVAAARAAGTDWEQLSAEKLYSPLGMKSTSSRFADYVTATNRAVLHVRDGDGKWVAKHVREPDAQSPAGGVSSSVRDLAQWIRLQLGAGRYDGKQLIPQAAFIEPHRPHVVSHPPDRPDLKRSDFYGLGWNVAYDDHGRVRLGHSGGFDLGAATNVSLVPAEQLGIVVLTNGEPIGVAEAVAQTFLDLVLEGEPRQDYVKLFGGLFASMKPPVRDFSKPPEGAQPPLPPEAYVGVYDNDYYGPLEVTARDDSLEFRLGRRKEPYPLHHWDRDTFLYDPAGEMATGTSLVRFSVDETGKAADVVLEFLDNQRDGRFTRRAPAEEDEAPDEEASEKHSAAAPRLELDRISLVGASLTAGFLTTIEVADGGERGEVEVDLGDVLARTLSPDFAPAPQVVTVGDLFFFANPRGLGPVLLKKATAQNPTLLVALDYLFWFGYGDVGPDESKRLELLEEGLALLDQTSCPVVVGDFPDMSDAVGRMLSPSQMPKPETLERLNARLRAWAAERPRVILFPLADLVARLRSGEEVVVGENTWPAGSVERLLQPDRLHPTVEGMVAVCQQLAEELRRFDPALPASRFVASAGGVEAGLEAWAREALRAGTPATDPMLTAPAAGASAPAAAR